MSSEIDIKLEGLEELGEVLIRNCDLKAAKAVVLKNASRLQEKAQHKAPIHTGTLMRSITVRTQDNGMTGVVGPTAEYGGYVEKGTRFMAAQPYLEPSLNEVTPQFMSDLKKLVR